MGSWWSSEQNNNNNYGSNDSRILNEYRDFQNIEWDENFKTEDITKEEAEGVLLSSSFEIVSHHWKPKG